jgi:hypothetical protein
MAIIKKTCIFALRVIAVFVGLFLLLVLFFHAIRWNDILWQKQHLNELRAYYQIPDASVEEQSFVDFDLFDNDLRLNEIRMIASHNSYKKLGSPLGKLFVGLGDSWKEAKALTYDNPHLTFQLQSGIRSFELDIRYRGGDFEAVHVPLVDNSTTANKLALALEEIALWSQHQDQHVPIILLMEIKDDWMILDPFLDSIGTSELALFDQLLVDSFGDRLYTPVQMQGTFLSPKDRVDQEGWPLLSEMLGKVIMVLHPGKWTNPYLELHQSGAAMTMFVASSNTSGTPASAVFAVHNSPNVEAIRGLIEDGYMVRTRMDDYLEADPTRVADAIASGAQIMTTDFHPAHRFFDQPYYTFADGFVVVSNTVLLEEEE